MSIESDGVIHSDPIDSSKFSCWLTTLLRDTPASWQQSTSQPASLPISNGLLRAVQRVNWRLLRRSVGVWMRIGSNLVCIYCNFFLFSLLVISFGSVRFFEKMMDDWLIAFWGGMFLDIFHFRIKPVLFVGFDLKVWGDLLELGFQVFWDGLFRSMMSYVHDEYCWGSVEDSGSWLWGGNDPELWTVERKSGICWIFGCLLRDLISLDWLICISNFHFLFIICTSLRYQALLSLLGIFKLMVKHFDYYMQCHSYFPMNTRSFCFS